MKLEESLGGRRVPVKTGEEISLPVDMVIKATGQMPFEQLSNGLENSDGKILISYEGGTSIKGVFAGGDCVNGGKEVVDAVQAGKEGALAILTYLF
jgi:glutamate synthase (NADPH/NADH) small chain